MRTGVDVTFLHWSSIHTFYLTLLMNQTNTNLHISPCQLNSSRAESHKMSGQVLLLFFWKLTMVNTCNEIAYGQCNRSLYLYKPISIYLSANPCLPYLSIYLLTKPCKVGFTAPIYRKRN